MGIPLNGYHRSLIPPRQMSYSGSRAAQASLNSFMCRHMRPALRLPQIGTASACEAQRARRSATMRHPARPLRIPRLHRGCAAGLVLVLLVCRDSARGRVRDSPGLRLADARMRYEAMAAYLHETAAAWRPAAGPAYASQVLQMKTYVASESTKLCAELFALSGGRHYRRGGLLARLLADSFAEQRCAHPCPLPSMRWWRGLVKARFLGARREVAVAVAGARALDRHVPPTWSAQSCAAARAIPGRRARMPRSRRARQRTR